jgi:hypothetical protein
MTKVLRIECSNGEVWEIPAEVIARQRAQYYADECGENFEEVLRETLEDDYELKDWAVGNMNWEDVVKWATRVQGPKGVDMQKEWLSCDKKVVTN